MKTSTSILNIFLASLTLFACQEFEEGISDIPVLTLNPIDEETITDISANLLCEVAYDTEASIWAENMSFRISENKTLSDEESLFVPVERFDETETEQEGVKKMSALGVATNLKPSTTYYYALYATDGHLLQKSDIQSFTTKEATGETPWQAIDLGLSVKWASCNVGARTPYQKGGYYAWGETNVKLTYTQDNYNKTEKGSNICDTEFDVAHVLWGDGWRMPTSEEVSELYNKCKWEYDGFNKGVRVKGPNGKSIFLPAGGSSLYSLGIPKKDETTTRYWSGSGTNVNAVTLHAQGNLTQSTSCPHYMGLLVRPVYDESLLPKNNFEFSNVTHTLWENGETGSFITEKNMGTFFFYDEKFRDNNIETYCTPDAPKWIPNADIPLNAEWMMAYAYWPYTQTYEMRDNQPYIPVDNNGQDYLYGACEYISNENTPTNMHMHHAMSEISFAITSEETVTVCEIIVKDNEHSLYKTGWMNVSTGNIGGTEAAQTVTFATKFEVGRDLTVYVNKHLFPMSFSENQIQVGCKIAETGDTIYNYLPADIWEKGQSYNYPITLTKKEEGPVPVGEAVDLGLSVKWANFNVGASQPEEVGGYYAWGETSEKRNYTWETYKWCDGTYNTLTKYCTQSVFGKVDSKTTLELEDDVANVKWGGTWRMPTQAEIQELLEKCSWSINYINGVRGYKVEGRNGNSIFLPFGGYRKGTSLEEFDSFGRYWAGTSNGNQGYIACYLFFMGDEWYWSFNYQDRYYGYTVRPVCADDSSSNLEMGDTPINPWEDIDTEGEIQIGDENLNK